MSSETQTPPSSGWEQAEEIVRQHNDFCVGHVEDDAPWCSAAPNGTPLCPACTKLARAIATAIDAQRAADTSQIAELTKQLAIERLSVPLEEELAVRIDEMLKYLAMEQGFTLAGIARLLVECQRRMAADWAEVGRLRPAVNDLSAQVAKGEQHEREAWRQVEDLREQVAHLTQEKDAANKAAEEWRKACASSTYDADERNALIEERDALHQQVERLKGTLTSIANSACCGCCQEAAMVARKALEQ